MLLRDVTIQLGADSPYEFITAPQWVRARQGIRIYHNDTQINVVVRDGGFWFLCNEGLVLKYFRLTAAIADDLKINQRDANHLLDIPNVIDKSKLESNPPHEEPMEEPETWFTEQNMKNLAFAMGMFCVATATVFGVKTVVKVVPKGRGK